MRCVSVRTDPTYGWGCVRKAVLCADNPVGPPLGCVCVPVAVRARERVRTPKNTALSFCLCQGQGAAAGSLRCVDMELKPRTEKQHCGIYSLAPVSSD